jgi:phage baseplate assembly protein W
MAIYSDISLSFSKHPVTNDIGRLVDINSITNSMRNILLTKFGERPFEPLFGSKVTNSLFELIDFISLDYLAGSVREALEIFEPRIELISVDPIGDSDSNEVGVTVIYYIVGAISSGAESSTFVFNVSR